MSFSKLFSALSKTRGAIRGALSRVLQKQVDESTLEELESQLIIADLGIQTVDEIISIFQKEKQENFVSSLKHHLCSVLNHGESFIEEKDLPTVILILGVNGTGKTTTSAKLAHYYTLNGLNPILIGADTYRAAAIDQLRQWSNRLNVRFIANEQTKDPSAILYDGLISAKTSKSDVVIVDTAGRLHTYTHLMDELGKMERIVKSKFPEFTLRSLLTIDAGLGQNSLQQAKKFQQYININGAVLTKMDGTAKGGIVFPLYKQTQIPVYFTGFGEELDNLSPFNIEEYVNSMVGD